MIRRKLVYVQLAVYDICRVSRVCCRYPAHLGTRRRPVKARTEGAFYSQRVFQAEALIRGEGERRYLSEKIAYILEEYTWTGEQSS